MSEKPSRQFSDSFFKAAVTDETVSTSSEDEDKHRSHALSEPSFSSSSSARYKNKISKEKLLDRFIRFTRNGEKRYKRRLSENTTEYSNTEAEDELQQTTETLTSVTTGASQRRKSLDKELKSVESKFGAQDSRLRRGKEFKKGILGVRNSLHAIGHTPKVVESRHRASELSLRTVRLSTDLSGSFSKKIRVILVGDPGVGKSTFLQSLINGQYSPANEISNLLADSSFSINHNGRDLDMDIRDTAGQERFRSLTASYYRYAHGCLVFFNVHNRESFNNVAGWLEDISRFNSNVRPPAVVLVGMIHRPARDRGPLRKRRSSLRGDEEVPATSLNKDIYSNGNSNFTSVKAEKSHRQQLHQQFLLQPPSIQRFITKSDKHSGLLRRNSEKSSCREIPIEQAENLASHWEIPYKEVDTNENFDSVLDTLHCLLEMVVTDILEASEIKLNTIVPSSDKKNSICWSDRDDTPHPFICCLHC
ncbi:ras-like GTP-binding protein ypt1 [Plakobranchus ocellatus]|uniref:Ras-like GTP-binding protein ypt1 n=1 Tax=Plakobranchus ocellatus TaxID=259542 RepID=A0AAV4B2M2_9GAST|nr:ras-like GTP-binding protein ypt1 [Plakobranchus ocellatus]